MSDTYVSRIHAQITVESGAVWIEDQQSRNGTWVNGQRIAARTRLKEEDQVQIGETVFVIGLEAPVKPFQTPYPSATAKENEVKGKSPETEFGAIRRRLSAFYDFGAEMGSIDSIEPLFKTIVEHLLKAIPGARRGALLIREGGELLLKAHMPEGRQSVSMTFANQAIETRQAFIWRRAESGAVDQTKTILDAKTCSAMYAPLSWKGEILGVAYVDSPESVDAFDEDDLHLLVAMANQSTLLVKFSLLQTELREESERRSTMLRWFSPKVAKRLLDRGSLWLGGDRVRATILCSDIRGFTAITRSMEPNAVVKALNETLEVLVPIIFSYDGTIDKYVGDSILAVFGSPEDDPLQCEHAVRAAVEMQEAMLMLASQWRHEGRVPFEIGIGIHAGTVLHGIIGSKERLEFTVIGDVVNRAARYCAGAQKAEVIISKEVYERTFRLIEVEPRSIKTKHSEAEGGDLPGYLVKGFK